jgi:hypothetical protein
MSQEKRTPHELWVEANGDNMKYRELMIQEGHLVIRNSLPQSHPFQGRTKACPCTKCGGTYRASWHVKGEQNAGRQTKA